jgi:hypothetical protein
MHERIGARALLERTRVAWAEMLVARGRSTDGGRIRELLGLAITTARELGLAGVERRATALLSELV